MTVRELISHLTTIANHGHALEEVVLDISDPYNEEYTNINEIELRDLGDKKLVVIK